VPPKGKRVVLRNNANLSTGGTATDVTDDVHPDVAARAVAAAQMVGLDICGVDVVCETVLKPLEEQGGGIVEVNAAPGLRMHLQPSFGKGRAVGEAIVADLFRRRRRPHPGGGRDRHQRQDHHRAPDRPPARSSGLRVGMTNTDGVYVGGAASTPATAAARAAPATC
jgi:cyanophycin synthetase